MKNNNYDILELQKYFSEDYLIKYINNDLSTADKEKVEYLLKTDEMYSDIFDGLMMLDKPEEIIPEIEKINKKIDTFSRNAKKHADRKYAKFRSIASLLMILTSFILIFLIIKNFHKRTTQRIGIEIKTIELINDSVMQEEMKMFEEQPNNNDTISLEKMFLRYWEKYEIVILSD